MRRHRAFLRWCLAPLIIWYCGGCIRTSEIQVPTKDEFVAALSELILQPEVTCEQLRHAFGVDYLETADNPADLGLRYYEYWLPTQDNGAVRVWYLPTELNRGTVVLSGGSSGPMACNLFHARLLAKNGWSTVLYEYRGFGLSPGRASIADMAEDLRRVVDWTLSFTSEQELTLVGLSIGSIPSIAIATEQPHIVNGLILDSPLALGEAVGRFDFVFGELTEALVALLPRELRTEELISDVQAPTLMFLHENDHLTTPDSIELLYERAPEPKRLVRFPGLGHARAVFWDNDTYSYEIESFLSAIWSQQVPFAARVAPQDGSE